MVNEMIKLANKKVLAEIMESAFHFLSISVGRRKKTSHDEDDDYSISKAFSESVLDILINSRGNENACIGAILTLQSYLAALNHDKRISELNRLFFMQLIAMNNEILAEILKTIHLMTDADFVDDNEKYCKIITWYEVETTFIDCLNSIVRDWLVKNGRGIELFVMNAGLANLLFQIIGVVGTSSSQPQQVLISSTGLEKFDNLVNKTKKTAIEILNHCISFWVRHNVETRLVGNNVVYMQYMILTLAWVTEKEDYFDYLEVNDDIRDLCIVLLENMIICTKSRMFADLFARTRTKVMVDVLFLFLATSEKERDDAEEQPKEFMNLALDVWDKQESKTIKTQAAKWIEAFCSKIDGWVSFWSMFCIQAIDWFINENNTNDQTKMNYIVLIELYKEKFLSKLPAEIVVETCLVALSVISFLLPQRTDIISNIDLMMSRNLDKLLSAHTLIQARMALFYGYYADILFKNNEGKFQQSIKFLFEALMYPEETIVVGHQAWETLITLIGDKNVVPRLQPLVSEFQILVN